MLIRSRDLSLALIGLLMCWLAPEPGKAQEVRESVYNYIIIERAGSVVRFRRMENGATVSAIDVSNPRRQVIPYTASLFVGAMVKPDPHKVLSIGLGAGAFNRLLEPAFPNATLVTAEIDPMILDIAKRYTSFQPTERDTVTISDGRRYLLTSTDTWDWIVLDAYVRKSQVPPHMTTVEFYKLVQSRLAPDGVFVANILFGTALFQSDVKTLTAAFPQVVLVTVPESGNVIALAVKYREPDLASAILAADVSKLPRLGEWGVDFAEIRKHLVKAEQVPLPQSVKLLTDDFSPVEFLDAQPMQ